MVSDLQGMERKGNLYHLVVSKLPLNSQSKASQLGG